MEMLKENYQHLNRLSEINSNTGVKFLNNAATPGSHCPMHTALATISRIQGVSSLVVGTAECGYYSRYVMRSPYGMQGELHYVYELDSNEVVFGCREGLKHALLKMIEEGAKVIVMIITCIPALIGEDANSIIEEIKALFDAKIVSVDAAHFKRNGYVSGYHMVLEQLIGMFEQKIEKDTKAVNIFGEATGIEYDRLKDQLLEQGIIIREYGSASSVALLELASSSTLSIVLSSTMFLAAKQLEKKHGVPLISFVSAYSLDEIQGKYQEIATQLSISFTESFVAFQQSLKQQYETIMKESKEVYQDLSYIATSPDIDVLSVSLFLNELGMKPELLHLEEFDRNCIEAKERLLQTGYNPYVMYISDRAEVAKSLTSTETLVSIGSCPGMNPKQSVSDAKLHSIMVLIGNERSLALLGTIKDAANALREGGDQSNGTI
jgi:nitrogenase molybdenum-iron protein alpha/beta subunit